MTFLIAITIMQDSMLLLLAGVVLAWFGGEMFVKGGVGLAHWARWPTAVIGVTVAAFGTSSPELMVAIRSAMEGVPNISLGDALGSNVVNIALVLAVVLSVAGLRTGEDGGLRRDWTMGMIIPVLMGVLLWDGWFSRMDALILLGAFVLWLAVVLRFALGHAAREEEIIRAQPRPSIIKTSFELAAGLGLLIGAAHLVVTGGKGVALALGWSNFIVGAVVVAAATSTPELATMIISRLRGHHDVGLGSILGSNIFNACFVAAIAALIQPYKVDIHEVLPSLGFGVVTMLLVFPPRSGFLDRRRGFVLLGLYAAYVTMILTK